MRHINLDTWSRRDQYLMFSTMDLPHFNMCANVELTTFREAIRLRDVSFTIGLVYVLARAANDILEFRYRIRDGGVVEHDTVHPTITILVDDEHFSFCDFEYCQDFVSFAETAEEQMACVKENPYVIDDRDRDARLYMTAIPWVSFTSFMHPLAMFPVDSVPRFAWGKFFEEGQKIKMPLSVQGHHALMDGLHMGRYYAKVQVYLDDPFFLHGEG